jgi:DNA-binding NarL/FixJ family response regulator
LVSGRIPECGVRKRGDAGKLRHTGPFNKERIGMSRKQLSMRKIEEVVRLQASGLSVREIARSCNLARSTVADYLRRLASQGWGWPLPSGGPGF